ncbi:MAG: hypothetical protein PUE32_03295 [Clostridia bacterium]|nr:hypothetical protein [Clostridia bacterium]
MKGKFITHFKKRWQEYGSFLLMLMIIFAMLYHLMDLSHLDINIPMSYYGGDDMGVLVNAKQFTEQSWVMTSDRLGAPYTVQYYDFTSSMMHNAGLFIMKIFAAITGNAVAAMNLTYLSIFFMAGIISYFVMRSIKINCWVNALASSVFAVSPYMLYRNIGHIVLTECYFVPLSILICLWIYERDDVLVPDRNFFKRKINYVALFFTFLIANNGIAYYPFFTCFIFLVTAISKLLKTGKIRQGLRGVIATVMVCFFVVLSILPGKIYTLINGSNSAAIDRSGFEQAELYGMKIAQLFMPVNGHGIYDKYIDYYNDAAFLVNENSTAYLGIIGMIGFIILGLWLFARRDGKDGKLSKRLGYLSELNIAMVLLGTIGGIGAMFAFFISPMLRGYNRISIFIEYVAILAVALCMDRLVEIVREKKIFKGILIYIVYGVFGLACIFSIWEGRPNLATPPYDTIREEYTSDKDFVERIENQLDEGAMIYQLPYHEYPEAGPVNDMWDYHLYVGFVHSDTLRWSYGSIKGREEDKWNKNVSEMNYGDMVKCLKEQGFAGIYVDRRAYLDDEFAELKTGLEDTAGGSFISSDNGNLYFIKF